MKLIFIFMLKFILSYMLFGLERESYGRGEICERELEREEGGVERGTCGMKVF